MSLPRRFFFDGVRLLNLLGTVGFGLLHLSSFVTR
jgi:hypothetical protein